MQIYVRRLREILKRIEEEAIRIEDIKQRRKILELTDESREPIHKIRIYADFTAKLHKNIGEIEELTGKIKKMER